MKYAKDIMTKDLITVHSGDALRSIAHMFTKKGISSAPVENPLGETIGILTELNLARALLREHVGKEKKELIYHHKDLLNEPDFVAMDASIIEVVNVLLKADSHRVYVVNNQERLTGVIAPVDILYFLNGEEKKFHDLVHELNEAQEKIQNMSTAIKTLKHATEVYKDLYEDAPIMMHSVDAVGNIIMANHKIHHILGYKEGELIGKTIFELYPKSVHAEALHGLKTILEDGEHKELYTTMLKKDGSKLRVDLISTALKDEHDKNIGSITVSRTVDSDNLLKALHGTLNK